MSSSMGVLPASSSSPSVCPPRNRRISVLTAPASALTKFQASFSLPSPSCHLAVCCSGSLPQYVDSDIEFVLHRALGSSGVNAFHAKEAREGFLSQIERLSSIERETSISINSRVDLGKTALYIAAEDDALLSHSSVPLPVDAFVKRLDELTLGYCSRYSSSTGSSPEKFLDSIEKYLFLQKGFQRAKSFQSELRALYLHSVLTHRMGSAGMLSLLYSEMLKMLRLWGLLDFDVEIFSPHDRYSLPRGYHKHKSKESDQPHILTVQALLEQILRNLKNFFWPFQYDRSKSLFLRAVDAATWVDRSNNGDESALQLAAAKAAQHRLERGVWTSVRFGDMRCALSACERLILLKTDSKELRDYSILLYHCGFFKEALQYLKLYRETERSIPQDISLDRVSSMEKGAEDKLLVRLNLISMEDGWSKSTYSKNYLSNNSEPW